MSYADPSYVIFDGDSDKWAYAYMLGWNSNDRLNFDFRNAHHLDTMTGLAQNEQYVKQRLRERMQQSSTVIVLVGANTKNLYKFVRWEIELARDLDLPIIVVNLNNKRGQDADRCPPIIRGKNAIHVAYKMRIIKYALTDWPTQHHRLSVAGTPEDWYYYPDKIYDDLGIEPG